MGVVWWGWGVLPACTGISKGHACAPLAVLSTHPDLTLSPAKQVRFYEVPEEELEQLRTDFRNGRLDIKIEEATFDMHEYNQVSGVGGGSRDWRDQVTCTTL